MVDLSILLKVTLVNSGGYHGLILHLHDRRCLAVAPKRLLNANIPLAAIRLAADRQHISAKIDKPAGDALTRQIFLDRIRRIALHQRSQVDHDVRTVKNQRVSVHMHPSGIHLRRCLRDLLCLWHCRILAFKIPEIRERSDRDIKFSAGFFVIIQSDRNQLCDALRHLYDILCSVVHRIQLALAVCPAENALKLRAHIHAVLHQLLTIFTGIKADRDHCVEIKHCLLKFFRFRLRAAPRKEAQRACQNRCKSFLISHILNSHTKLHL